MRLAMGLIGVVVAALAGSAASATVRITSDTGGQLGPYLENLQALRSSGERVVIDGPCLSACTMVLGVISSDHICVTPRARLGFHAAWLPDGAGQPVTSTDGTKFMMDVYPQHVRKWIARHGGLSPRMIYLTGRELASMYASCPLGERNAFTGFEQGRASDRHDVGARVAPATTAGNA